MSVESILQQLNNEIANLTKVRALLISLNSGTPTVNGKRAVSAASRRKMAKAQRARWAKVRAKKRAG